MQVKAKPRVLSRTLWVNVVGGIVEVVLVTQEVLGVLPEGGIRQKLIPVLAVVLAASNIILRHLTSVPIEGTKAAEQAAEGA